MQIYIINLYIQQKNEILRIFNIYFTILGWVKTLAFQAKFFNFAFLISIMQTYKSVSHTRYDLKYHIVWITKYCKPVMIGQFAERLRELIR